MTNSKTSMAIVALRGAGRYCARTYQIPSLAYRAMRIALGDACPADAWVHFRAGMLAEREEQTEERLA